MNEQLVLAVELITSKGSLALINGERIIDTWEGENTVSKAEDFLLGINEIFNRNKLSKNKLAAIIHPFEFSSITANRICRAIILGLEKSLCLQSKNLSMFEILLKQTKTTGNIQIAIQVSQKNFLRSNFIVSKRQIKCVNPVQIVSDNELRSESERGSFSESLVFSQFKKDFKDGKFKFLKVNNLASMLARGFVELNDSFQLTKA